MSFVRVIMYSGTSGLTTAGATEVTKLARVPGTAGYGGWFGSFFTW